jgi:hypothetical protein
VSAEWLARPQPFRAVRSGCGDGTVDRDGGEECERDAECDAGTACGARRRRVAGMTAVISAVLADARHSGREAAAMEPSGRPARVTTEEPSARSWVERWIRFVVAHARGVLVAVALVTVALATGIARLHAAFDVEAMLPAGHPLVEIDRTIRREFGGRHTMLVAIVPHDGDVWRPEVLAVVRDATEAALALPGVMARAVVSLAAPSVRHVEQADGEIRVDYLMREVPRTASEIAALRARLEDDPLLRGLLVTPDQRAALLIVDFWDGPSSAEIAERARGLAAAFAGRGVDLHLAGAPMGALLEAAQSREVARRIPVVFLVIAATLLVSFRTLQGMAVPLLTAVLSTVWVLGAMGHQGIVVDAWNVAVPSLVLAVAAGHSAQMLKRYTEEVARLGDNRLAVISSMVAMAPVMLAAGGTATLGFASLVLFGVPAIANFGLACAYGIGSAVVLETTFIPALRALLPAPRRLPATGGPTRWLLGRLGRGALRHRGRRVVVGTAIALALAGAGAARLEPFGSTRVYMPRGSPIRRDLEAIERHFPGIATMTVLYEGEPGAARRVDLLRHMAALEDELARDPLVLRTASLADLVKALHEAFNPEDPVPYRVPEDQQLVAQLMFLGESPAFERYTDRPLSKGLLLAHLRSDDSARVGPLLRRARAWCDAHPPPPGVRVLVAGGSASTTLALNEHTTYGKLVNMAAVLAAIWVVAAAVMRSPLAGAFVVVPIVVSLAVLFGAFGWSGVRLDMGSASLTAMAAGVGADYAIYFLYRLREERARRTTDADALGAALGTSGRAILFVATSISAGFAVNAFSTFYGLRLFGTFMPLAMLVSSLAALSVLPVLVLRTRPRFVFAGAPERGS